MDRRKELDFAKGVGIVLMVLGHCYSAGNGENVLCWLYSFHMPLFFIVPGIVYSKTQKNDGFLKIIIKKIKRLLVPYFFFATIIAMMLCIVGRKTIGDFVEYIWRIVTLRGINAMWFIPCFLIAELLFIAAAQAKDSAKWILCKLQLVFLQLVFLF